jgi:hypothetical protein
MFLTEPANSLTLWLIFANCFDLAPVTALEVCCEYPSKAAVPIVDAGRASFYSLKSKLRHDADVRGKIFSDGNIQR